MRLSRILAVTVALCGAPYAADASPIQVSFAGIHGSPAGGDPWGGSGISGFFVYDDIFGGNGFVLPEGQGGCGLNCDNVGYLTPVLDFLLNVGSYRFTLADVKPGAVVLGPLGNQFWGPYIQIKSNRLPPGIWPEET